MKKRKRQKGVQCSVDGCGNWCTGNDLCQKHNQAMYRYGSVEGKAIVKSVCKGKGCRKVVNSNRGGEYCSEKCRRSQPDRKKNAYKAVKDWRSRNLDEARRRDSLGKRTKRRFPDVEVCVIEGCEDIGERHHPDYDKPYEIVWLCKDHHGAVRKGGRSEFAVDEIRVDEKWKAAHLKNLDKIIPVRK